MDVTVTIGPDTDPITITINDDNGWSPDQLDDACRRAGNEALRLHREKQTAGDGA